MALVGAVSAAGAAVAAAVGAGVGAGASVGATGGASSGVVAAARTVATKLGGYELYKALGSPKYLASPMVDQSELAFRMVCRQYGAHLCYTPMLHSRNLAESATYRATAFTTCPGDRPLIAQLCGNDPKFVLAAAKHLEQQCDAVDLNLGCPQKIAKRGHYGAYLLEEPDLVCSIVQTLHENLAIPVTCKIRLLPKLEDTLLFAKRLQAAGCQMLTVHGRTKEAVAARVAGSDWDAIKAVKAALTIPVFANGGMGCLQDVKRCLSYTGCDGVMLAEGLLDNPAAFSEEPVTKAQVVSAYLECARLYPTTPRIVKMHLFRMLHGELGRDNKARERLGLCRELPDVQAYCDELFSRIDAAPMTAEEAKHNTEDDALAAGDMAHGLYEGSLSAGGPWYMRHRGLHGAETVHEDGDGEMPTQPDAKRTRVCIEGCDS